MASLQCLKRVHLEANRPELKHYTKKAEAAFALGHEVGDIARRLYGGEQGTLIGYEGGSLAPALAETRRLMDSLVRTPIFEATLRHDGVLMREDVLLPVGAGGERSWRIVEVKASTQRKPEHVHDCAVQAWVHRESGHPLAAVAVAHIDNQFVYPGDGRYEGLLVEEDLTQPVFNLLSSVPGWIERARDAVAGPMPEVPVGQHCGEPYDCPFIDFCWPRDTRYPVQGLGGSKRKLGVLVMNGWRDIREVPAAELSGEQQLRIHRVTQSGTPELLPGARAFVAELSYPRFYLDFETVGPAVPVWAGTRPYEAVPFQWSCHVERAPGQVEHREFLDLSGAAPMRALAERLIETLESDGPVLTYTDFEARVMRGLAGRYPDLAPVLEAIAGRLVDLHPVTKTNYYHPDMLGSWSIKAVLPTVAPDMDYAALGGIQEGTEASSAYLEAIAPQTPPERREEIRAQLLRYCRHDTEAMMRLVDFFAGD